MRRIGFGLVLSAMLSSAVCQEPESKDMPAPTLPFYDWKACPFEGCAYRQWIARKSVVSYDTWKNDRRPIAQISKGDTVFGVTGVVITFAPGLIRVDRDLPDSNLKQGDTILTYTYRGEGFSAVWFKGKYYTEFDISFTKWPDGQGCGGAHCAATYVELGKKVWWAEVKLKSGRTAWVNMEEADFEGIDLLGGNETCSISARVAFAVDRLHFRSRRPEIHRQLPAMVDRVVQNEVQVQHHRQLEQAPKVYDLE